MREKYLIEMNIVGFGVVVITCGDCDELELLRKRNRADNLVGVGDRDDRRVARVILDPERKIMSWPVEWKEGREPTVPACSYVAVSFVGSYQKNRLHRLVRLPGYLLVRAQGVPQRNSNSPFVPQSRKRSCRYHLKSARACGAVSKGVEIPDPQEGVYQISKAEPDMKI